MYDLFRSTFPKETRIDAWVGYNLGCASKVEIVGFNTTLSPDHAVISLEMAMEDLLSGSPVTYDLIPRLNNKHTIEEYMDKAKSLMYNTLEGKYGCVDSKRIHGKYSRWEKIVSTARKINMSEHAVGRLEVATLKDLAGEKAVTQYIRKLNHQIKYRIRKFQRKGITKAVAKIQDWCLKKPSKFWAYIKGQRINRVTPAIKHTDHFEVITETHGITDSICFTNNARALVKAINNQYGPEISITESSIIDVRISHDSNTPRIP